MIMHSPSTSPTTVRHRVLHLLLMAVGAAALLIQAPCADAQHASPPPSMSDKEKAKIQERRAYQKDTDDAYQSTMSRLPDVKQQKVDPWGNMRAAPQK